MIYDVYEVFDNSGEHVGRKLNILQGKTSRLF